MTRKALGWISAPWLGAILSLLVVGAVVPSASRAGCLGVYVTSRTAAVANATTPEVPDPSGAFGVPGSALPVSDASKPPSPSPCTGALCSGDHAPPVSTSPGVPAPGREQWGVVPAVSPGLASASLSYPPVAEALRPVDGGRGVFHPPR